MNLSPEFSARLQQLRRDEKVRALIILQCGNKASPAGRRGSQAEREAMIADIKDSTAVALAEVDRVLARFDGRRLGKEVDAIGSVLVETTAQGIMDLAGSKHVKAVLEDQPVALVR